MEELDHELGGLSFVPGDSFSDKLFERIQKIQTICFETLANSLTKIARCTCMKQTIGTNLLNMNPDAVTFIQMLRKVTLVILATKLQHLNIFKEIPKFSITCYDFQQSKTIRFPRGQEWTYGKRNCTQKLLRTAIKLRDL